MLTVILIDPNTKVIEKRVVENDLQGYYRLLNCQTVESGFLGNDVWIYFDEEAKLKTPQSQFIIGNRPIMGRAMVLRVNQDGEAVSVTDHHLEIAKQNVEFID